MWRILCVDDDKDSCEIAELTLRFISSDYEVTTAQSSLDALALIAEQRFDLYILDYWMPQIDGLEICRRVRQTDVKVPIVILSADAYESSRPRALKAGANEYLTKPNGLLQLSEVIPRLLLLAAAGSEKASRDNVEI